MSDKVKLPKKVADALKEALGRCEGKPDWLVSSYIGESNLTFPTKESEAVFDISLDTLIRALYIGYEVEETPEDKVREYYEEQNSICTAAQDTSPAVIRKVLNILGIDIGGVNT